MEERVYRDMAAIEETHWWFRGRRAAINALIARAELGAAPRVLDAGCGTGRNLLEYARLGGTAVGAEPEPAAVALALERGVEVVQADAERLPFGDASFDLVAATDVLEHTDDDVAALRELHRVAAPGAVLLATVPAYRWLWSGHDDVLQHRRRYTRPELVERARAAGWQPFAATYFNTLLLPLVAAARKLGRHSRPDHERGGPAFLAWPMLAEAALIRRGVRFPAGVSIGLLARR
jgi:SAM-dependent methyltransferase